MHPTAMVKDGYWYSLPLILIGGGLLGFGFFWPGKFFFFAAAIFFAFALFVLNFFRDPERLVPSGPGVIVSPADGRVVEIRSEEKTGRACQRISIFMSPFNVHVNRSPVAGRIESMVYRKGSFRMASEPRASVENECNTFTVAGENGEVVVRQIAGVLARRIVFWKKIGDYVGRGDRVGMIKFGSRVEILLSPDVVLSVKIGDHVKAGSTIIGIRR
ncbi:MAG: phosphatidylserine decarboxylase [Acidobacteria bacterium]|nr:MAG: phosphatidylserine decarboxylase [Acidobacteriota bacterium]